MFTYGFKNNEHVEKIIITGILRVAKASLFSGLNNFSEYGILDDYRYSKYFGFTEFDVNLLLKNYLDGCSN